MRDLANAFFAHIKIGAEDTYHSLRPNLRFFGLFGIVAHAIYYVANIHSDVLEVPWLRIFSVLLIIAFMFSDLFERTKLRPWLPYMVVSIVFFLLIFFSTYVLIQALVEARDDAQMIAARQVQLGLSMACIVILVPEVRLCCLGIFIATLTAWLGYSLQAGQLRTDVLFQHLFVATPLWGILVLVALYYGRNREVLEREKNRAMTAIGSNIAHELRTPLLGIRSRIDSVSEVLPLLIENYEQSTPLEKRELSSRKLELLADACADVEEEASLATTLIDIFIANLSGRPTQSYSDQSFNASDAVSTAFRRYPFASDREKLMVTTRVISDFKIQGSEIMVVHILFNLIKNALHFTNHHEEPVITIVVSTTTARNTRGFIEVTDNGRGISRREIRKIFRRFYTTDKERGTGIGLSFCETAIRSMGGEITVRSQPRVATSFRLSFPDKRS